MRFKGDIANVNEILQQFAIDPLLAVLFFAFVAGIAGTLVFLFDRMGGPFAKAVNPVTGKLASVEGLRGILAASVVAHHGYLWYFYTQTGQWTGEGTIVFVRCAVFGVTQFFFISGFLFWRKLMKTGSIPLGNFYLSRFIRIGPAYYTCVGAAILTGLVFNGFRLQVPPGALVAPLLSWLLFSVSGLLDVNHMDVARITCGVTWTLALEWMFYLSLPFLGWFSRRARRLVYFALTFGTAFLVCFYLRTLTVDWPGLNTLLVVLSTYAKFMLIGFGGGILIAALELRIRGWMRFVEGRKDWLLLALYLGYLMIPGIPAIGLVLLLPAFALVVNGASLFGFLTCRPVRLLGVISYPLYLVHGMVFYIAMRLRGGIHAVNLYAYLGQTAACVAVILALATIIHLAVERPTMRLSEHIARRARLPQAGLLEPAPQESAGR